jgi:hypothetical protein
LNPIDTYSMSPDCIIAIPLKHDSLQVWTQNALHSISILAILSEVCASLAIPFIGRNTILKFSIVAMLMDCRSTNRAHDDLVFVRDISILAVVTDSISWVIIILLIDHCTKSDLLLVFSKLIFSDKRLVAWRLKAIEWEMVDLRVIVSLVREF